jgi:hypothetical protein
MTHRTRTVIALLLLIQGFVGCGQSGPSPMPAAPSPAVQPLPQPAANQLVVFRDPLTGLSTSDVRDAQDDIVQFTTANELIWAANGTRLPGHYVEGPGYRVPGNVPAEPSCQCWLVVRFGARQGERRAYLTGDIGHSNPGTVVDVEITGGALIVSWTDLFPPGSATLSGVVTEATATGLVPLENVEVWRLDEESSGWDHQATDQNGFYELHGLSDGSRRATFSKEGYQKIDQADVPVHGDTRFDVQLVRR